MDAYLNPDIKNNLISVYEICKGLKSRNKCLLFTDTHVYSTIIPDETNQKVIG